MVCACSAKRYHRIRINIKKDSNLQNIYFIRSFVAEMANIAAQRIRREFKEVIRSEDVSFFKRNVVFSIRKCLQKLSNVCLRGVRSPNYPPGCLQRDCVKAHWFPETAFLSR